MKTILLVGFGGFAGSVLRYYISRLNLLNIIGTLPFGTLVVNVSGSFILGLLIGIADRSVLLTPAWRLFLMVGFCGGFTTFSTFAGENLSFMRNGQIAPALLYTAITVFAGYLAVYLGYIISKAL